MASLTFRVLNQAALSRLNAPSFPGIEDGEGTGCGKKRVNLLFDPLLRVKTTQGVQSLSLPALLAALAGDRVESLLGLQRHQEDAFHIFLCYLPGPPWPGMPRPIRASPRLFGAKPCTAWRARRPTALGA